MSSERHLTIVFIAFSLERGGAERQMVNLAAGLHRRGHKVSVVLFRPGGGLEKECHLEGIPVVHLQQGSRSGLVSCLMRLVLMLRRNRPDIVHSYLPVVNVAATFAAALAGTRNLVWGVRSSFVDFTHYASLVKWADLLQRHLYRGCRMIIANSEAGKNLLVVQGIPKEKITVIPNGIDTQRFTIDRPAGQDLRKDWGIGKDEILVGLIGRLDPMKDHETFLSAIATMTPQQEKVRFVCVGGGTKERMAALLETQNALGLEGKVLWAGEQADMPSVMNALDILCLSSKGEGFPNVLGEALACGVPCVSTDVGDAALVVDDPVAIVPPQNPGKLAQAMGAMISKIRENGIDRNSLRDRIETCYSIDALIKKTETHLNALGSGISIRKTESQGRKS